MFDFHRWQNGCAAKFCFMFSMFDFHSFKFNFEDCLGIPPVFQNAHMRLSLWCSRVEFNMKLNFIFWSHIGTASFSLESWNRFRTK
jgi:hypothetical protein